MSRLRIVLALALGVPGSFVGAHAGTVSIPPAPSAPAYRTVADIQMTVSNSSGYANFRAKPTTASKILAKLPQGTNVVVIDQTPGGKWVHVKVGDKQGYIETKLLK